MKPQSPQQKTNQTPNLLGHPALKAAAGVFGGCRFLNPVAYLSGADLLPFAMFPLLMGEGAKGCDYYIPAECLANVAGGRANLCQVD